MCARVSADNGKTWAPAQRISSVNKPNGRATHAKSFASGPRIHLTWTDAPEGAAPPARGSAAYYATSPDGGLTWSEPERVCPQWNDAAPHGIAGTDSRAVILLGRDAMFATVRERLPGTRIRQ